MWPIIWSFIHSDEKHSPISFTKYSEMFLLTAPKQTKAYVNSKNLFFFKNNLIKTKTQFLTSQMSLIIRSWVVIRSQVTCGSAFINTITSCLKSEKWRWITDERTSNRKSGQKSWQYTGKQSVQTCSDLLQPWKREPWIALSTELHLCYSTARVGQWQG